MPQDSLEYDLRQYELMTDRLEAFQHGKVSLRQLVEDLRSLVAMLQLATPTWKDDFISEWWNLEQVYAVAIDRDELDQLPRASRDLVARTNENLRVLVDDATIAARQQEPR